MTAVMGRGKEDRTGTNPAGDLLALGCSSGSFTLLPYYGRRPLAASYLLHLLSTWIFLGLPGPNCSFLGLHGEALALGCRWRVPRKSPSPKDTMKWRRRSGEDVLLD